MIKITYAAVFGVITALWIAVRLIIAIKNRKVDWKREGKLLTIYVCLVVIARFVYFPWRLENGHIGCLVLDTKELLSPELNLVPLVRLADTYEGWQRNIIGNIAMFIPVGICLPFCFEKLNNIGKVTLVGAGASLFIELSQLLFVGRYTDVDDLILNTVGVAVGAAIWFAVKKAFK